MGGATKIPQGRDEATDASQFLCRLGYAVLGLAGPAGVVLHPVAIFVIFPIGVALLFVRCGARSARSFPGAAGFRLFFSAGLSRPGVVGLGRVVARLDAFPWRGGGKTRRIRRLGGGVGARPRPHP